MAAAFVLRQKRATASHFGNGGEVANLLSEAKLRKEKRRKDGSAASRQEREIQHNMIIISSNSNSADGFTVVDVSEKHNRRRTNWQNNQTDEG